MLNKSRCDYCSQEISSNSLTQILWWHHDRQALLCDLASHPLPRTQMALTKSEPVCGCMHRHVCTLLHMCACMCACTCMPAHEYIHTVCMHGHIGTFTHWSVSIHDERQLNSFSLKVLKIPPVLPTVKSLYSASWIKCSFVWLVPASGCLLLSFSFTEKWKLSASHQETYKGLKFF